MRFVRKNIKLIGNINVRLRQMAKAASLHVKKQSQKS